MEAWLTENFQIYANQPYMVYGFLLLLMTASSFGLPVPEEFTLVTVGFLAYTAKNQVPISPNAVNMYTLAIVSFLSVMASDVLVYSIGRFNGEKLKKTKFFKKKIKQERYDKINSLFQKYSGFAIFGFRFMPGVRFPGHLTCGMSGVPFRKFLLIDGLAALISVPTQVILVAIYGKIILATIDKYKYLVMGTMFALFLAFILFKMYEYKKKRDKKNSVPETISEDANIEEN